VARKVYADGPGTSERVDDNSEEALPRMVKILVVPAAPRMNLTSL
jgi:hypothetical protein